MADVDTLLGTTALYGWQQPSPAVLLFPGFYHELLYFVDRMQTAYPNYHPCVPTLVTNHRRRYLEFLSKWMYTRGTYLLYLNLPNRHVLAVHSEQASGGVESRYVPKLLNLQTYTRLQVGELAMASGLRVLDFHMVERAAAVLESRAMVERRSKQCWVQTDWRDEAEAIRMDEDELMSEAEEQRRHSLHRERQVRKQSELAALAALHQTGDGTGALSDAVGLEGHKVAREAVAGVRVPGGEGQGGGREEGRMGGGGCEGHCRESGQQPRTGHEGSEGGQSRCSAASSRSACSSSTSSTSSATSDFSTSCSTSSCDSGSGE